MSNIARQPKGRPTGGQFAANQNSDSGIDTLQTATLDPPLPSDADDDAGLGDFGFRDDLTAAEALEYATKIGNIRARMFERGDVDGDDLAQEALLHFLQTQNKERYSAKGILRKKISKAISVNDPRRAEDIAATRKLNEQVDEFFRENHREPTPAETDAMAGAIRAQWHDPQHRPSEKFHRLNPTHVMTGAHTDEALAPFMTPGADHADDLTAEGRIVHERDLPEGELSEEVLSRREDGRSPNARGLAWAALAEKTSAPLPVPASLSRVRAGQVRKTVTDAGGVAAVAARWSDGEQSDATEALFAPFGDLDNRGRQRVVDQISVAGRYSDEVWDSSVLLAKSDNADFIETWKNR